MSPAAEQSAGPTAPSPEQEALVLARPVDADLACSFLRAAGVEASRMNSVAAAAERVRDGTLGALLVAEETLGPRELSMLAHALEEQPTWSDVPLVLFASRARPSIDMSRLSVHGTPMVLDRPLRRSTMVSAVRLALRARRRQVELRDLVRRLEEANDRLRDTDRRKDEFLAMLGHELRNPLSAITAAVHLLRLRPSVESSEQKLTIVERQVRHLAGLVDDLLDVTRVTLGRVNLEPQVIDLCIAAERCAQAHDGLAARQSQRLLVTRPSSAVCVLFDPLRLEQVLTNLVTNALKYTHTGGTIQVIVESSGGEARLRVRDDGIGIDRELLTHLFEPFAQGAQPLARSKGGLGLGLAVVKGLVERQGGRIEVHSDGPGRGSEFVVRLPLSQAHVSLDAGHAHAARGEGKTVVIVEDNEDARECVVDLLRLWGHRVFAAVDGLEGLELIVEKQPDFAIVDIGLPKLDGYEVARQLRRRGAAPRLLIALTGYGQPEDRQRALEAGFDNHLVKPLDVERLRSLLADRTVGARAAVTLGP